jgi:hypothetical protein
MLLGIKTVAETYSFMALEPVVFDVESCSMGQPAWKILFIRCIYQKTTVIPHQGTDKSLIKEQKILDSLKKQMIMEHRKYMQVKNFGTLYIQYVQCRTLKPLPPPPAPSLG